MKDTLFRLFLLGILLLSCSSRKVLSSEKLPWFEPEEIFEHDKINTMSPSEVKERTAVKGLEDSTAYAGYVEIDEKSHSSMHFVFYEAMKPKTKNPPLILWLQGGPGCSDWTGVFLEIGPHQLYRDDNMEYHLKKREYSWNEEYHLLFVDNPVGAGYSYAGKPASYVHTQADMALQLYYVLQVFFQKFSDYAQNDMYIFGESYAGKYIPSITKHILTMNAALPAGSIELNLKGIGIGDGWTDPAIQSQYYSLFGLANGLIDEKQYENVIAVEKEAIEAYNRGEIIRAGNLMDLPVTMISTAAGDVNVYNFRRWGPYPDLLGDYMNKKEVKEQFNVPDFIHFVDCNGPAYNAFNRDEALSVKADFPYILSKIPVLFYNGQNDLIVQTPGSEAWIRTIDWPRKDDYLKVDRKIWKNQDGEVAGYVRSVGHLVQAVVADAGHMVPRDQIKNSQNMVDRFIKYVEDDGKGGFLDDLSQEIEF